METETERSWFRTRSARPALASHLPADFASEPLGPTTDGRQFNAVLSIANQYISHYSEGKKRSARNYTTTLPPGVPARCHIAQVVQIGCHDGYKLVVVDQDRLLPCDVANAPTGQIFS